MSQQDTPYGPAVMPVAEPVDVPAPRKRPRKRRVWPAVFAAAIFGGGVGALGTAVLINTPIAAPAPAPSISAQHTSVPYQGGAPNWTEVASQVRPAVVAIQVRGDRGSGAGSGVLIDDEGRILTNDHVVGGAESVQIMLMDGRLFTADLLGTDPTTDLAVVQIQNPPADLRPAQLGTSDELTVGEPVMAVGNPLGLDSTVTTGIISALERPVVASDSNRTNSTVTNAIQVDAAINPGNSGGPLFNSAGQVIGINSSIATTSARAGSVGLGFAIPIDLAHQIAEQLITHGKAEHAFLGVSMRDSAATAGGVTRMGARVEQVDAGTPAAQAGVATGDVIIKIDDHTVGSAEALTGYVRQYRAGQEVTLTIIRDGTERTITATLTTRPEPDLEG